MATHDYNLANQSGASFRSDLNDALQAVLTNNSSASSPSTTAAYMFWADTNTGILKIRNSSNDAWVELLQLDGTLTLEDGSASAVALGFRDELNTGIFSSGANNFDISIAGTTRLNISATGLNVTGTVTDDGATHDGDVTFTGASANVVFDKSDNALEFADNAKATFGADSDLTISHDGSNSIINDNGTGELQLQRAGNTILTLDANGITVTDPDGDGTVSIKGFEGQSAKLELIADEGDDNGDTWTIKSIASDNDLAIQNNTSGSNATLWEISTAGDVTQTGHLSIPDSKEIRVGSSNDLKISHDGSNSIINDAGTGELLLQRSGDTVLSLDGTGISVQDLSADARVAITAFEGSDAKLQLIADEGDDNGDKWEFTSIASSNDLALRNDTSGSLSQLWKIGTDGVVRQTAKLEIIAGASSMIHLGESSGDFSYRLRANVSSSANGGFLIEDGNGSADLYKVVSGSSGSHNFFINGTQEVIINSGGRIGVGTTTPSAQVEVINGSNGRSYTVISSTELVVERNGDTNLAILGTSAGNCRIHFGDEDDENAGNVDYDHAQNDFTFFLNGVGHYEMDTGAFHPTADNADDLGRSSNRFDDVRATNGSIVTSDRNEKNTIVASDLGLDFVNKLTPVSYKFNNKTRTHYGLIAQDIETLLGTIGKSATDFAGFCKDEITIKTEFDEYGTPIEVPLETPFDRYSLRYTEFIAPIIKAIQELSAKVTALEGS